MSPAAQTSDANRAAHGAAAPRIDLLSPPSLLRRDGTRCRLERKAAAILAITVIDGPTSRAALAGWLWPHADEALARNNLRQLVFRLRRSACEPMVTGATHLTLAAGVGHDLGDAAQRLALDPDASCGELLAGCDYAEFAALSSWVDAARLRWRQRRADLLAQFASQREARGEIGAALRYALRLVANEPQLEHAHRHVIRLHYLRGDRSAALDAYERCRHRLRSVFGIAPGRETELLAELIAGGTRDLSAARPQAVQG